MTTYLVVTIITVMLLTWGAVKLILHLEDKDIQLRTEKKLLGTNDLALKSYEIYIELQPRPQEADYNLCNNLFPVDKINKQIEKIEFIDNTISSVLENKSLEEKISQLNEEERVMLQIIINKYK